MAEWAQERLEEVWVPVGEQLRLPPGLITAEECHAMLQRIRTYEHSLINTIKDKCNYVSFIAYITQLLELINDRREQHQFKHKKGQIEEAIIQRALAVLSSANFRFAEDIQLWKTTIQFCIKHKRLTHLSKILMKLLQFHGHVDSMWVFAAKNEFEVVQSVENARAIFLQGLKRLPNSVLLKKEYFKFELLAAQQARDRILTVEQLLEDYLVDEYNIDVGATALLAEIIFENIKSTDPFNFDLISQCWSISLEFKFAATLSNNIEKYMDKKFKRNDQFWKVKLLSILKNQSIEEVKLVCGYALQLCEGSKSIFTSLLTPLLDKISTLTSRHIAMTYFKLALEIFTKGIECDCIEEPVCFNFLSVLKLQDRTLCHQLLDKYLTNNSESVRLSVFKIEILANNISESEAKDELRKIMTSNMALLNSVDFWTLLDQKLEQLVSHSDWLNSVLTNLLTSSKITCHECKLFVKRLLIKLIASQSDQLTNQLKWTKLQSIISLPPIEYSLMGLVLKFHSSWLTESQLRWLYEHFSRVLGPHCVEIWADYKQFLNKIGDIQQANLCNDRALRQISKDLVPQLITKMISI